MKKLAIIAMLALTAGAASAQSLSGFATYDYDRHTGGTYMSVHEGHAGVKLGTPVGSFDVAAVETQDVSASRVNNGGFEAGYSLGTTVAGLSLSGRASYGQVESDKYYGLEAVAKVPVASKLNIFGGYRYRHALDHSTVDTDRATVGVETTVAGVTATVGYARMISNQSVFNGVTTAVSYKF